MTRDARRALFCAENFFDDLQFPNHTVTGSSGPTGAEEWRVATGRRNSGDAWQPATANSTHWVAVDCAVPRTANWFAIDRGHNLSAKAVYVEARQSTGNAWATVWSSTAIPSSVSALPSTNAFGVVTEEGAVVKEFFPQAYRYWRLRVPPSTGFTPKVVGFQLGLAFRPADPAVAPWDDEHAAISYDAAATPSGWVGAGRVAYVRKGAAAFISRTLGADLELARFREEYGRRRMTWYVPRRSEAQRAMAVVCPSGELSAPWAGGVVGRRYSLQYVEHEPEAI